MPRSTSTTTDLAMTVMTEIAIYASGLVTGVLTARLLMPEGRGAVAAILFWPQLLAAIGLLSLNDAATFRIGTTPTRAETIVRSALFMALPLAGVSVLVAYHALPLLLGDGRAHLLPIARTYLLVFVPFNYLALVLLSRDQGELRFARYNALRFLMPATYLVGLGVLWATDRVSVGGVVGANCAAVVIAALVRLVLQPGLVSGWPSRQEASALVKLSARLHAGTVLLFAAEQADKLVVLMLWDDVALGQYVVALTVAASGLAVVTTALRRVLYPHLARRQGTADATGLLARTVRYTTLAIAAVSVPLVLGMPSIIATVFGPAYADATGPAMVLVIAYGLIGLKSVVMDGVRGIGEPETAAATAGVSVTVFLIVAWLIGTRHGLAGVGMALALANAVALGYTIRHLSRRWRVAPRDLWGLDLRTLGELRRILLPLPKARSQAH
jgi:O-antigen/teichoic acid export membrane protein